MLLFIYLLPTACTVQPPSALQQLDQADSLLSSRPDSALRLLEAIPAASIRTQADRARYALLLTQAQDENHIFLQNDSLIRMAVRYYEKQGDARSQAQAYCLWGSLCINQGQPAQAIQKYLMAVPLAKRAEDGMLLGHICNSIGSLYYSQKFYAKADSIYRLTERLGIELQDTCLWAEALSMQGRIRFHQQRYHEAESFLGLSQNVLGSFKQNGIRAGIASALSLLCIQAGKREEAVRYAKQNIAFQDDNPDCHWDLQLLGEAYFQAEEYDSALVYLNKSLSSSDWAVKGSAYMRLAVIAEKQGDIALSLEMERLHSACQDSLSDARQDHEIMEAEQQVLMRQQQMEHEEAMNRYHRIAGGMLASGALLFGWLHRRYRRKLLAWQQGEAVRKEAPHIPAEAAEADDRQTAQEASDGEAFPDLHTKMQRIIADSKNNGFSREELDDEEWQALLAEADREGFIRQIAARYRFSNKEIRLCCLTLLGFSATDKARIMHYKRPTIYRTEQDILKKMGVEYQSGKLQEILMNRGK